MDESTRHVEGSRTDVWSRRHLCFGLWSLLLFVTLGAGLEAMHGFRVSWYLDVGEETRRLLWRLAHAHGAFLALLNLVFAGIVRSTSAGEARWRRLASPCLLGASIALPAGFFLGGTVTWGSDPGLGIFILPIGVVLLFTALLASAWGVTFSR